jgi:hypothetical protein
MAMRLSLLKLAGLVIVAVCLGGHISELFDRWENALSGNDVDYTCVLVAAVAGAVIVVSGMRGKLFPTTPTPMLALLRNQEPATMWAHGSATTTPSPPLALRI